MRRPTTTMPAKLRPPEVRQALLRPRLFRWLDAHTRKAAAHCVWVSGPPGAGKSTLVTSYLRTRRRRAVWFRIDEGDDDPACLFHYLTLAARSIRRGKVSTLPAFVPDPSFDTAVFARRYFEAFFACLPRGQWVVFDNVDVLRADSEALRLLRLALAAVSTEQRVILLSREPPPAVFAHELAAGALVRMPAEALTLTGREALALARLRLGRTWPRGASQAVARMHAHTRGWAAGLALWVEHLRLHGDVDVAGAGTPESIFDYLASELFERLPTTIQQSLVALALPPLVSEKTAEGLATPLAMSARALLLDLTRRTAFITRRGDGLFEIHPLLRVLLLGAGRRVLGTQAWQERVGLAARLLAADGQDEIALTLVREHGTSDAVTALIAELAPSLLAQGRHASVLRWLDLIPADRLTPRLTYWAAEAALQRSPATAAERFVRAYEGMVADGDEAGALLACCGVVDANSQVAEDLRNLDPWVARIEERLAAVGSALPPAVADRALCSLVAAGVWRAPPRLDSHRWRSEADALVFRGAGGVDESFGAARISLVGPLLVWWHLLMGAPRRAALVLEGLRAVTRDSAGSPLVTILLAQAEACFAWQTGRFDACREHVTRGLAVAAESGVHVWDMWLMAHEMYANLASGNVEAVERRLDAMSAMGEAHRLRPADVGHFQFVLAWTLLLRGQTCAALEAATASAELLGRAGARMTQGLTALMRAETALECGLPDEVANQVATARRLADETGSDLFRLQADLVEAQAALKRHDDDAFVAPLARALDGFAARGFEALTSFAARPEAKAEAYGAALGAGIQVDYVRSLIVREGLAARCPDRTLEHWPWKISLRLLGGFELRVDGALVGARGKVQKRPLELLEALVARRGAERFAGAIADEIWPEAEGDASETALRVTLHRLRKLAGGADVVTRRGGRLALAHDELWVDAWAFEDACDQIPGVATRVLERAVALYRGPFVDSGRPWATPTGERLAHKFVRAVGELGGRYESVASPARAEGLYRRALELVPADEMLARRLQRVVERARR